MVINTFVNGTLADADDVNDNFSAFKIISIDATTDLNYNGATSSTVTGTSTANKTYNISSSDIGVADYLVIEVSGLFVMFAANGGHGTSKIKIENTSRGTTLCDTSLGGSNSDGNDDYDNITTNYFKYVYTLDAADKSGGCNIKITVYASNTTNYAGYSFTNRQVIFSKIN